MKGDEYPGNPIGTIIEARRGSNPKIEIYCGLLDYYEHWAKWVRAGTPTAHHEILSHASDIFGHDLVNMATYANEILNWLEPDRICLSEAVVAVGGMTEAFLVSIRSACDAIGRALGYVACEKRGQAPSDSLRTLINWASKNSNRVNPSVAAILSSDLDWFWSLRTLRDHIVHNGAHAIIHTNRGQFNLFIYAEGHGWTAREPLLPILARQLNHLLAFGNRAASAINEIIQFPNELLRSRVVAGLLIPALHKLMAIADQYGKPFE